ncbi:hypothetical protein H0H87_011014 [Tephrocybe sp. NHM501043]|nr:hypothetical protein H0H87_011014 [Tephrocybe sp. NHM501043]
MSNSTPSPTQDVDIESLIPTADELKEQGNDYFRSSQWDEALVAYQSALGYLPKRIDIAANKEDSQEIDAKPVVVEQHTTQTAAVAPKEKPDAIAKRRAVLNANIGACYVKLAEHQKAIDACSQALLDDPEYIKALQRRASSNDILDSWSSLTAAQEDYNSLIKLLPPSSSQLRETEKALSLLKPRLESAQKRETAEMMSKLKGLGNSILGNFGLSTDNFKFEPNGQGGYSMNFQR